MYLQEKIKQILRKIINVVKQYNGLNIFRGHKATHLRDCAVHTWSL